MTCAVLLLARARRDLEEIYAYTHERWGRHQAEAYLRQLARGMDAAAARPDGGRRLVLGGRTHWRWRAASHLVLYSADAAGITILRVLHARMDAGRQINAPGVGEEDGLG